MKTCKLSGTGGIVAVCIFLLSVSCTPVIIPPDDNPDNKDSTTILPPKVNPNGFIRRNFVFRLFSLDSVDLFAPNIGSKYNYSENEHKIWLWYLAEKIYTGAKEDTLIRFYAPNLDNSKWIVFGVFKDLFRYDCDGGDFNIMGLEGLIKVGDLQAEHSTMYIEWDTHDFDTIYTTFRKQVEGTPEFPYGYYTFDSIWYNGKLAYTWERFVEDFPCNITPIIIKENP